MNWKEPCNCCVKLAIYTQAILFPTTSFVLGPSRTLHQPFPHPARFRR
jgi:hypothetical protein